MSEIKHDWKETLLQLLALASRLEREGQYNLAKLARATADSLSRQAAYTLEVPSDKAELFRYIKQTADQLAGLDVNVDLITSLMQGAETMLEGGLPLIDIALHPYVCRTCGHVVLGEPRENCPTCDAWSGTYQRFLPVYWLDALEPFEALERLRQTPIEVKHLIQGLSESELNQRPADGGWAVRNVLTHLRDAQGVLSFRLDLFLSEEHPLLESKAVFSWATKEDDRLPSALEVFETYKTSRQETCAKLASLPLADWWKTGQHQEFGIMTLKQQVSYFASHELTHLPQIATLRGQLMKGE
jgi:uncharacterized damage-inducible protein DinB